MQRRRSLAPWRQGRSNFLQCRLCTVNRASPLLLKFQISADRFDVRIQNAKGLPTSCERLICVPPSACFSFHAPKPGLVLSTPEHQDVAFEPEFLRGFLSLAAGFLTGYDRPNQLIVNDLPCSIRSSKAAELFR